ncbi:hypothetical protein WJX72_005911 [[Myrmecia] bisecta]|uniref:PPPDE domain-containing protein n=1 Tax=[Myrmecia] bisecta TaxID=41462 RepID=A0AAW1PSG4_9CHLO
MSVVQLHVYDVTSTSSENTNIAIQRLNDMGRIIGSGGVFHGALEVNGVEWSYGFCEHGTGVYGCEPKKNPMYTFRESIVLGVTSLSDASMREVITRLQREWPGCSYDLLTRNCCHFCEELAKQLGVSKLPGWLNRFAYGADATVRWGNGVAEQVRNLSATTSSWWRQATLKSLRHPLGRQWSVNVPQQTAFELHVSRATIAGASEVFRRKLEAWKPGPGEPLVIEILPGQETLFRQLIQFIYTEELDPSTADNTAELWRMLLLANYYAVDDCAIKCASLLNNPELELDTAIEIGKALVAEDELVVQVENTVFSFVIAWMRRNSATAAELGALQLRYAHMTVGYLRGVVAQDVRFKRLPDRDSILIDSLAYRAAPAAVQAQMSTDGKVCAPRKHYASACLESKMCHVEVTLEELATLEQGRECHLFDADRRIQLAGYTWVMYLSRQADSDYIGVHLGYLVAFGGSSDAGSLQRPAFSVVSGAVLVIHRGDSSFARQFPAAAWDSLRGRGFLQVIQLAAPPADAPALSLVGRLRAAGYIKDEKLHISFKVKMPLPQ